MRSGDDPKKLTVRIPDDSTFDALNSADVTVHALTYGGRSTPNKYWTEAEILSVYDEA
jgi:hypothetical protein